MGSKTQARKPGKSTNNNNNAIGKGKVTPVQVAFIVDRYLADNNFSKTRSVFRSEASSLISKSSLNEAPKSLMSLGELLDEYILLKEQKVMIEQQKNGLAQEGCRISTLLQGMQNVMNTYNSAAATCTPSPLPPVTSSVSIPIASTPITSSAGYPASRNPVMASVSMTQSVTMDRANAITPISSGRPPRKRRNCSNDPEDPPQAPKKIYSGPLANYPFRTEKVSNMVGQPSSTSSPGFAQVGSPIQESTVAKALFDKPSHSPTSNSCDPKTPPQSASTPNEKPTSLSEDVTSNGISHHSTAPPETAPTNCTIFSSKTIIVSPAKRYTIERNECTFSSPSKANFKRQNERDHVKGRLNFDSLENVTEDESPTMSELEKQGDIFDLDLPNFDTFGPDFSLSELLTDFGIGCENLDYPCSMPACASSDAILGSFHEDNEELGTSWDLVQHSSAVTEVAADKAVNGSDSITSMKSVSKCIRIVSPSKSSRNRSAQHQENHFCSS